MEREKEGSVTGLLRWPLIIAAIVVVLRVVLEQSGAPESTSNLASAAVLYLVVFPIYFAVRISESAVARPFVALLKTTALYTALVRAMIIPTYWLAYIYQWPAERFSINAGGVVGPGVTPIMAYVVIPVVAALIWIVTSMVI